MFEFTILNEPLNEVSLRRWAFDEDMLLSDQDEDLLLHQAEYLPILILLADDPSCPKDGYILSCLDHYLKFIVLCGLEAELEVVRKAIKLACCATTPILHNWANLQQRRLRYREGLGPVSKEQALIMGEDLLNGIYPTAEISLIGESHESWKIQLSTPPPLEYKERLTINKATGHFVFSR